MGNNNNNNITSTATTTTTPTTITPTTSTTTTTNNNNIGNEIDWSPEEQKLLENALKKYSKLSGKEKWEKISQDVQTRSIKECVSRYKYIVNMLKNRKEKKV